MSPFVSTFELFSSQSVHVFLLLLALRVMNSLDISREDSRAESWKLTVIALGCYLAEDSLNLHVLASKKVEQCGKCFVVVATPSDLWM